MSAATVTKRVLNAGPVDDLPEGGRRIVSHGKFGIGVFHVNGRFHAIMNYCPHEGAELCRGRLTGTNEPTDRPGDYRWGREGRVLRCPWHAWEFDLETGVSLFDPKLKVRTFPVSVEDGQILIHL